MNRSAWILALWFALMMGCSSKKPAPAAPEVPAAPVVTLKDLQNGDRACYVVVQTESGEEQSIEGAFELCESATGLIGQRVTYTTEKGNVLAASCEGDMDCGKSDEVDLVVTITAAP